jgi:hypothetical protein
MPACVRRSAVSVSRAIPIAIACGGYLACTNYGADPFAGNGGIQPATSGDPKGVTVDGGSRDAIDAGGPRATPSPDAAVTAPSSPDAAVAQPSCKAIRDGGSSKGDGTYVLANGARVYCDMTLDGGGWMLIANVPQAPKGYWEKAMSTSAVDVPPADLSTIGVLTPDVVDKLAIPYTEVLFTDTSTKNWFTVAESSDFYRHNYRGTCGDNQVVAGGHGFAVTGRSSGSGDLAAYWLSGCPNQSDFVTTQGSSCGNLFVAFDVSCSSAFDTRVRAYVR